MVTVLYNVQRNNIFEQYDNCPQSLWRGSFNYPITDFVGEELVILDIFGEPTIPQKIIPFGKYKNHLVSDVPDEYLRWLTSIAYGPLKSWCVQESEKRFGGIEPLDSRTYSGVYRNYDYDELCEAYADYICEDWGDRD